ncbi:prokineticin receptor 2-like [Platysternon megacephalum]|uniref:Prokineticin receptor 2-like n=1 Tax=Platysternon megacephalum TaxID=55544 RepID=A0A4D9DNV1_9SAUR|nr:prokineticin receptor 2-like [Platysternon megacephalum]
MSVQQRKNRAVIIVNYEFLSSPEPLRLRRGAKREADKLFKALSKLNYAVKLHYDQEAQEIEEIYRQGCTIPGIAERSMAGSVCTKGSILLTTAPLLIQPKREEEPDILRTNNRVQLPASLPHPSLEQS